MTPKWLVRFDNSKVFLLNLSYVRLTWNDYYMYNKWVHWLSDCYLTSKWTVFQLISNNRKCGAGMAYGPKFALPRGCRWYNGWIRSSWSCNGPPMTTRDKILVIRSFCKFSFTCKECDIHHRLSTHSCPVQKANILFMTRNQRTPISDKRSLDYIIRRWPGNLIYKICCL